jgi:predicted glycosyltransferase
LEECSILVLTDFATIGRFKLAERVDYVHLPGLGPRDGRNYSPHGLSLEYNNSLRIRRKIAQSAIRTFRPDLVILDDSLLNLPEEMQRIVAAVAEDLPQAKIIWGMSDTLGEPEWVYRQWAKNEVLGVLDRYAHEILIFGVQRLFDVAEAYRVPARIAAKFVYTGYLLRQAVPPRRVSENVAAMNRALPMIMLTPAGNADDFALIDAYLRLLESDSGLPAVRSFIVAGSAIRSRDKQALAQRARKLQHVTFQRFGKHALHYVRFADLVICAGGYVVLCEVLGHRKMAIVVPNSKECPDNSCRARLLQERGLVKVMLPSDYHPLALREMVSALLFSGPRLMPKSLHDELAFDGFAKTVERIRRTIPLCGAIGEPQPMEIRAAS